ncbi:octopamine receptor-like isoform X1 [Nymphalis io]|uniref:octopamine receptor-like isoform X1 n=2 Tax=Inachis io TaxID=171585 RepID=UPI0021693402|nr:octopamine receptor-like isoform X1 [Nymphalis io]
MMRLQPRGDTTTGWWVACTAMMVITVATVLGNTAVMLALWRARRAPSHYPLTSLVLADLLVGIMVQPLAAARELFVFNLNWAICSCWSTMDVLCCTASILSLCALGWERWSGITAPLARARRGERARILAALVWPVAALVALPNAFIPSPRHFHPGELEKACTVNTNIGYVFFSITFSFYLPAGVLVTLYGFILRALSAPPPIRAHRGRTTCRGPPKLQPSTVTGKYSLQKTEIKTDNNQNIDVDVSPKGLLNLPNATNNGCSAQSTGKCSTHANFIFRQRRATRTIVMLMALFLICWTPYFVMLPLDSLCDCVWETTWQWCTWLGYINSALNPLVYAAASPSVRRALHTSLTSSSSRNVDMPLTPRVRRG